MSAVIPEDIKASVRADRAQGMRLEDIAKKHGIGATSVWRIVHDCTGESPIAQFQTLSDENRRLQKAINTSSDKFDQFSELLMAAAKAMPVIRPIKPGVHKGGKLQQELHALRSDEQAGAKVTAMDTSGIGGYNLDIYVDRLHKWADKVILFKDQDCRSLGLNKLVIHRLGDWLEGECIYPGQAFYIDAPVVDVMYQTVLPHEREVMRRLASHFEFVEQFCVQGNHGRVGKKGDHHWMTSFENILYRTLQIVTSDQLNVKTFISDSIAMLVQHGSFTFCLDHGAHLTSNYGVPYYSMDRTFKALPNLYNRVVDVLLMGHRHTPSNLADQVLMNGSMMGGSDLSVNKMKVATRASQKIFYFDKDHGINRESNIYLENKPALTADGNGIYTPYSR